MPLTEQQIQDELTRTGGTISQSARDLVSGFGATNLGTKPVTIAPTVPDASLTTAYQQAKALQDSFTSQSEKDLQTQRDTYLQQLKDATIGYSDYANKRLSLEQQQGIDTNAKELKDINLQIADAIGALGVAKVGIQDKNIPQEFVDIQQESLQRNSAAKLAALQARQQALSGNLDLSQKLVERSLDLQFKPIEQKITALKSFLDINQEQMTAEQKKRADAMKIVLDQQNDVIANQKQMLTQTLGMATRYPDAGILPTDDFVTAQAKVLKSKQYLNERTREQQLIKESGTTQNAKAVAQQAETALLNSRGGGQFADGNVYAEQKRKYIMSGGSASNFDSAFSYLLSDEDKKKFTKQTEGNA